MAAQITASPVEAHTKGQIKRLRNDGYTPVALQHKGEPTTHLQSRTKMLDDIIHQHGTSAILELLVEPGKKRQQVLIHQVEREPISRRLRQVTLQAILKGQPIKTHVSIRLQGDPEPVRDGLGVLQHPTDQLEVRGIPGSLPDHIDVDISGLNFGDSIRVSDLPPTTAYEILSAPDSIIASVTRLRLPEAEEKPEVEEPAEAAPAEAAAGEKA